MAFDWIGFFEHFGIPYVTSGPNVAEGNVYIQCPFCGGSDPSQHMGVHLERGMWGCWRDRKHSGRKPDGLLLAILGSRSDVARAKERFLSSSFVPLAKREERREGKESLRLPEAFLPIKAFDPKSGRFSRYLRRRGFYPVSAFADNYDLRYCHYGSQAWRIIIPAWESGRLIGWTGRAIGNRYPRYKDSGPELKETLLNHDSALLGGRVLVVVEGPFDCLWVDWVGREFGVRAVGLFGKSVSSGQASLLFRLKRRFEKVVLLLDADARSASLEASRDYEALGLKVAFLPKGVGDPAELSITQVMGLADGIEPFFNGSKGV